MRRQGLFRLHQDQEGVTAIIVALCLISLFGMLVLVVDVGGLLWKRREMVSGADAAALAAAKTCAVPAVTDPSDPKAQANTEAMNNVGGLTASNMSDWQTSGCTTTDEATAAKPGKSVVTLPLTPNVVSSVPFAL